MVLKRGLGLGWWDSGRKESRDSEGGALEGEETMEFQWRRPGRSRGDSWLEQNKLVRRINSNYKCT